QQGQVQQVVHGSQLEPALSAQQPGIVPYVGLVVTVKVLDRLLDEVAALDDILGLGLVVGLGKADDVDDVGLHVHLPVGGDGQVALGPVQVGRKVGQAAPGLFDDVIV